MWILFNQVRVTSGLGLFYAALLSALSLPDICAAMDTGDGRAHGPEYMRWFDRWVSPRYTVQGSITLSGRECYELRCSMLHQGRGRDPGNSYGYFAFVPGTNMHNISLRKITVNGTLMPDVILLSIPRFCGDVVDGAEAWLDSVRGTGRFQKNYEAFLRLREGGIPGYVAGQFIS
jgi:hypothetical protein